MSTASGFNVWKNLSFGSTPNKLTAPVRRKAIIGEIEKLSKKADNKDRGAKVKEVVKVENRTKTWTYRVIASLAGIAILLLLVYYAGFEKFFRIIIHTSPYWIIVSVIIYAISWIFRVQRLKRFTMDAGEKIEFFELFKLLISGYTLNILLPARLGDVATIFYLKMKKIAIGKSTAIIFQLRILVVSHKP